MPATDTLYEREFHCTNKKCKCNEKRYKWATDQTPEVCEKCSSEMIEIEKKAAAPSPMIIGQKMSREAIKADRRKRSSEHFQKEVLPTLGRDERIHHGRKGVRVK